MPLLRTRAPNQDKFQMSIPFAFRQQDGRIYRSAETGVLARLIDKLLLYRAAEVNLSGFITRRFWYIS